MDIMSSNGDGNVHTCLSPIPANPVTMARFHAWLAAFRASASS